MFIQTEETPNENSLKFLPGCLVLEGQETYFFEKGKNVYSPLARRILEFAEAVLLGQNFITVTKRDEQDWYQIKPLIIGVIVEHFVNKVPIFDGDLPHEKMHDDDDPIVRQIRIILDTRIRPAVAQDGGDIIFDSFKDGIVYLRMQGACSGCPRSTITLKSGIENMLKHYVPEVQEVKSIYD